MPPRTQLEFLTNADPSVSSNFAQTAATPGAFHSLTPTTGASEAGMCRRLLGLVSFPPLSGVSLHISAAWGRTSWKSRELASPCCCGLHFVWGSLGLLRRERQCRLGESGFLLSEHSGEGLSQLVVLHRKVTKKRKKYPCVCCLQTDSCQISLAK